MDLGVDQREEVNQGYISEVFSDIKRRVQNLESGSERPILRTVVCSKGVRPQDLSFLIFQNHK